MGRRSKRMVFGDSDKIRARFHILEDFTTQGLAYFSDEYPIVKKAMKKIQKDAVLEDAFTRLAEAYEGLETFDLETSETALRSICEEMEIKAGLLINGTRAAVTGQIKGPGLFEILVLLGQDKVVARLRKAATLVK